MVYKMLMTYHSRYSEKIIKLHVMKLSLTICYHRNDLQQLIKDII